MTDGQPDHPAEAAGEGNKEIWFFLLGMVIMMIVINDLLLSGNGGGVYSLVVAVRRINANAPAILVDSKALLTAHVAVLCLGFWLLSKRVVFELHHRGAQTVVVFGLFFGAIGLNAMVGHRYVGHFMQSHGYARCEPLDRKIGGRRSRVWLDGYVRAGVRCPVE